MINGQSVLLGCFAISKNGHDRGQAYVITSVLDECFVLVVNGLNRTIQKPKRKNLRHLFITKSRIGDLEKIIKSEPVSANLKLVTAIKDFQKREKSQKGVL